VGIGSDNGSSGSSAPVPFGTGYALRQNGSMPFTASMSSADEVLPSMFVDFKIVGDVLATSNECKESVDPVDGPRESISWGPPAM
jgi:hypothetical protein